MTNALMAIVPEIRAQELQKELEYKYPDLTVSCEGNGIYIRGAFPIIHEGVRARED